MSHRVISIDNFLSEEECTQGVSFINSLGNEEFKDNALASTAIHNDYSIEVMNKHSERLIPMIKAYYQWKPELYLREGFWTIWKPGSSSGAHSDAHGPDLYDNLYSVVIYLNDDYVGGKIFFPHQDVIIQPTKGQCVIFPCGGYEYFHGVTEVEDGLRMTLALWYWDGTHNREF